MSLGPHEVLSPNEAIDSPITICVGEELQFTIDGDGVSTVEITGNVATERRGLF